MKFGDKSGRVTSRKFLLTSTRVLCQRRILKGW